MRAICIPEIGTKDNLQLLTDAPIPEPKEGQALIKVHYAGVNRPDLLQRKGLHPAPKDASEYPGLDIAGEIVAFGGHNTSNFQEGDLVCALLPGGGYAEYAIADLDLCLPLPQGLTTKEAASLPECMFTVWNNVFAIGQLSAGETILIHGGTSGIGSFAIQMAKAAGARVITTAGSPEKVSACLELGADLAINYKQQDFQTEIENNLGKDSINLILDMVGGEYLPKNIALMAENGHHVSIAYIGGMKAELNIQTVMKKRLRLTGSTLRHRPLEEKASLARSLHKHAWPWLEEHIVKPKICAEFALEDALKAHAHMQSSTHIGKILLKI